MLALAVVAQLADLLTRPPQEANALVVALGPSAWLAKCLLVVLIVSLATVFEQVGRPRPRRWLLSLAAGVGAFGTATNLATWLHWHP